MSKFDHYYSTILNSPPVAGTPGIYTTTIPRNSLDPTIFQFIDGGPPIMQGTVKTQIISDVEGINRIVSVTDFIAVGDVLSYNCKQNSDLEINVLVNLEQMDSITTEAVYNYLKMINGRLAVGSTHPINYYIIQNGKYDASKELAAYDVASERWIKEPKQVVKESIIDYVHKTLDPRLWDISQNPPMLRSEVKERIIDELKNYFKEDYDSLIDEIHITGSIGTQQWRSKTDIDVHIVPRDIEINKEKYEELQSRIMKAFRIKDLYISEHPLEVYLQLDPEQEFRGDASYDVLNDKWIKLPFTLSSDFDPDVEFAYLKKDLNKIFSKIDSALGELRRDLVDHDIIKDYLKNLNPEEKTWLQDKLVNKINEIENDINHLIKQKEKYHQLRKNAYGPEDEEKAWKDVLKSKSWAPSNVMWKILDRYKYVSLILDLQKVMRNIEEGESLDTQDINKVKKVFDFKEHYQHIHEVRNPKRLKKLYRIRGPKQQAMRMKKQRWKDPLARHIMVTARGLNRKNVRQVPNISTAQRTLPFADKILTIAKNADMGTWKLSSRQLVEIVEKYGLKIPDAKNRFKKLGKTGILLWYKSPGVYLLVKLGKYTTQEKSKKKFKKLGLKKGFKKNFGFKGKALA